MANEIQAQSYRSFRRELRNIQQRLDHLSAQVARIAIDDVHATQRPRKDRSPLQPERRSTGRTDEPDKNSSAR